VYKVVKADCSGICELSLVSVYEYLLFKAGMHQMLLYSVTEMILMVVQLFVKVGQISTPMSVQAAHIGTGSLFIVSEHLYIIVSLKYRRNHSSYSVK
jgi:hypothetical protein